MVSILGMREDTARWFQSCDYANIQMGYLHVAYTQFF